MEEYGNVLRKTIYVVLLRQFWWKLHDGRNNASFYPDGDGYYCSQFIAELLPIFETIPMKFGDEEQEISPFWEDYYREIGLAIPLDQSGTNPSQLAQSPQLQFKERYLDDYNH